MRETSLRVTQGGTNHFDLLGESMHIVTQSLRVSTNGLIAIADIDCILPQ